MKDFTDQLVDLIIENERDRMDKVMNEVTKKVSIDFATEMFRLLDEYYKNYDPTSYVRVYHRRGKNLANRHPKRGQVSLHAAVVRGGADNPNIGTGTYKGQSIGDSYFGGIEFNESEFKKNKMRHLKKGISEWNIVENFLFAGDAGEHELTGDWRSVSAAGYDLPSPDESMNIFMDFYDPILQKHVDDALKKF